MTVRQLMLKILRAFTSWTYNVISRLNIHKSALQSIALTFCRNKNVTKSK